MTHERLQRLHGFVVQHLWPLRRNRLMYLARRVGRQWRLVHETSSPITGAITVWQLGRERRMVFGKNAGDTAQSVIFTRGSWAQLAREYWGHAVKPPSPLPPNPRVLILGLGGGTMVHLVDRSLKPQNITVVELDPVVVDVARSQMGLEPIPNVRYIVGDVYDVLNHRLDAAERFDLVIEDIFFGGFPSQDVQHARTHLTRLLRVLSPGGTLVLNRWFALWNGAPLASGQNALEDLLLEQGYAVSRRQIKQRWFNELIFASRRET